MPRTCTCNDLENCSRCRTYETNPAYAAWALLPKGRNAVCRHRGAETRRVECSTCAGKVELKVFACAKHGECTAAKPTPGLACCLGCPDYEAAPGVQIDVTADGIGDAVLGLAAAAGLRQSQPDAEVVYRVKPWQLPWAALFNGYDRLTDTADPGAATLRPHDTYGRQMAERTAKPRWEYYAEACGVKAVLPAPKPLPAEAVAWAERFRGWIVLSPFSLTASREWLVSHWLHLERLLVERGRRVVVVDGRTSDVSRTHVFRSVVLRDEPAVRIGAVLALADCVVANDSGMAHVAGMLRAPTVALCAQIDGRKVYGIYPTVKVINASLACADCHWQGAHGWHPVCDRLCANLQSISPADVLSAVESAACQPPGYVRDPATDRTLGSMTAKLCAAVPDRRRTVDAFLRALSGKAAPRVVETGCMRGDDDYGAGMSTQLFGRFLAAHGGGLTSLDSVAPHVSFARSRTRGLPVEVVQTDSRDWLRAYAGPSIDALYLDSQDTWEPGYEECCLDEAKLAVPRLAPDAVLMIDDTYPIAPERWKGKGSKAVPWLLSQGWRIVCEGYQMLLSRAAK